MIKPTVGQVLWFRPGYGTKDDQPFNAQVVFVHGDRLVNIAFHDHAGRPYSAQQVLLVQEGDEKPSHGRYVEWMPYQTSQAKKHEPKLGDKPEGIESVPLSSLAG